MLLNNGGWHHKPDLVIKKIKAFLSLANQCYKVYRKNEQNTEDLQYIIFINMLPIFMSHLMNDEYGTVQYTGKPRFVM